MADSDNANEKRTSFLEYIEQHERAWGMDTYPGRPSLSDLLNSQVVAFWHPTSENDKRPTATVHKDMTDLNVFVSRLLLHISEKAPDRRLARLFVGGKKSRIKGVQLLLVDEEVEKSGKLPDTSMLIASVAEPRFLGEDPEEEEELDDYDDEPMQQERRANANRRTRPDRPDRPDRQTRGTRPSRARRPTSSEIDDPDLDDIFGDL